MPISSISYQKNCVLCRELRFHPISAFTSIFKDNIDPLTKEGNRPHRAPQRNEERTDNKRNQGDRRRLQRLAKLFQKHRHRRKSSRFVKRLLRWASFRELHRFSRWGA